MALVAGVLAIAPGPVRAADPKPDYLPTFDACPEDIPDAFFSDVSSRHPVADINCIAYYGITKGTDVNRYSPDNPVTREQMALFLVRMAEKVGIDVPAPGPPPFNDIWHLTLESQDAISKLAQLGITQGTGDNQYTPARNVSRGEMALFLQRLMNLMDVPEHRGAVYGYLPADVEKNLLEDADVDTPYTDMRERTVSEFDAVEQLYELGVATGVSSRAYGPARDMSRSHMAQFMAAILDHSNLRPDGVHVQLTPTLGWEDYNITVMISARAPDLKPLADERVDWFYTDHSDGALQSNGECDPDRLIEGDCIWDDDRDDLTDDFGNYFEEIRAVPGEVLTFYAWIGDRDDQEFDEDTVRFDKAEARSDQGPDKFVITSNISENAGRVIDDDNTSPDIDGAWIVDRDVQRSVRLTIQLEDESGRILQREGLEIAIEEEEWDGSVETDAVDNSKMPKPTFSGITGNPDRRDNDQTILTNQRGEATYELDRPRGEGATLITLSYGDDTLENDEFAVLWSKDDPVAFSVKPTFEFYYINRSSTRIAFDVDYDLYDQYGTRLNRRNSAIGRDEDLKATLEYTVYDVDKEGAVGSGTPTSGDPITMSHSSSGRISHDLNTSDSQEIGFTFEVAKDYFVVLKPNIRNEDSNEVVEASYAQPAVVWIVGEADNEDDYDDYDTAYDAALTDGLGDNLDDLSDREDAAIEEFKKISVDTGRDEFRTYFTIWEYDSNDDFFDGDDKELTITQFENLLNTGIEIGDLEIRVYYSSSTRSSSFTVAK